LRGPNTFWDRLRFVLPEVDAPGDPWQQLCHSQPIEDDARDGQAFPLATRWSLSNLAKSEIAKNQRHEGASPGDLACASPGKDAGGPHRGLEA
jgi:hypothetical protein